MACIRLRRHLREDMCANLWLRPVLAGAVLCFLGGCQTIYEVKVDAINDPRAAKGVIYELRIKPPDPTGTDGNDVMRYVRAALAARGYVEAEKGVSAEQVVEVDYGVGPARLGYIYKPRDMLTIDLWGKEPPKGGAVPVELREKYLRVTARSTAPRSRNTPAPEVWSVHLVVEDEGKEFTPYLPALAAALVDYIGEHAAAEMILKIKEADALKSVQELTR